jgi:RNA polymerase sigma-70 factor (ECF subfamily)
VSILIPKNDEDVAKAVQSGQVGLFGILVDRYENKIKRYARKFLFSPEDAQDAVQNIFLKAYENINNFDTKRKFSTWLYRIAHNELINSLKKKKTLPLFDLDKFFPHRFSDNGLSRQIDKQDARRTVSRHLEKLEPKYREPIILYYLEEFSYKEIADVLHIPISTVGIRIKRAKTAMKANLEKTEYNL